MRAVFLLALAAFVLTACNGNATGQQDEASQTAAKSESIDETGAPADTAAVEGLIHRLLPKHEDQFICELIPAADGLDVFEIDARDGKVLLRGNTNGTIATGLNWYLKYHCHASFSWFGEQMDLPETLPLPQEKTRRVSPYKYRTYLNYCTFGYTMPWWTWDRWQREVDWMALHGVNQPLAVTGTEAAWQKAFEELGLTREQMKSFFSGPAFLPWFWMANLDGYGGPLPQSWIDSHAKLGRRIVDRERAFGMTPILQGFSGRVPDTFAEVYPDAKVYKEKPWLGMFTSTWQMDPLDPMFTKVGSTVISATTEMFGRTHFYAADPFHEGAAPSNKPEYFKAVADAILGSMTQADPDAVWAMQSWTCIAGIIKAVPQDRLLMLDLNSSKYRPTDGFWGRDFVWGYLGNFGGRMGMGGHLNHLANGPFKVRSEHENMVGMGAFPEGIETNEVVYDLFFEMAWRTEPVDLGEWLAQYARRRYGTDHPAAAKAWHLLQATVYRQGMMQDSLMAARPGMRVAKGSPQGASHTHPHYDPKKLAAAWAALLECSEQAGDVPLYQHDVVDIGRQVLVNLAVPLHKDIVAAFNEGDMERFDAGVKQFRRLALDLDELLATREEFLLGKWIADARAWGETPEEKDLFEYNARMLVTLWGPDEKIGIYDYAWRTWSGLVKDYQLPRWEKFFAMLREKLEAGEEYVEEDLPKTFGRVAGDANDFYVQLYAWEQQWTRSHNGYSAEPSGDPVAVAKRLCEKYKPVIAEAYKK